MKEQNQDQNPAFVHKAFSAIASRYVLTNHVLSFGIDVFWRKKVASLVAEISPSLVVDVATGSGDLAMTIQKANPEAQIYGMDFCAPMLAEAKKRGLVTLIVADGLQLPLPDDSVDSVTIGYGLRNMADWGGALQEFKRVLRPGGRLVILDFSIPTFPPLKVLYRFYLHHVLPRVAGWLTKNREAYAYLGDSIERFPSGADMISLIESKGFEQGVWYPQLGGISSVYSADYSGR